MIYNGASHEFQLLKDEMPISPYKGLQPLEIGIPAYLCAPEKRREQEQSCRTSGRKPLHPVAQAPAAGAPGQKLKLFSSILRTQFSPRGIRTVKKRSGCPFLPSPHLAQNLLYKTMSNHFKEGTYDSSKKIERAFKRQCNIDRPRRLRYPDDPSDRGEWGSRSLHDRVRGFGKRAG